MSNVRGHVSGVICIFFFDKVLGLVGEGSVINGPTPSSLVLKRVFVKYFRATQNIVPIMFPFYTGDKLTERNKCTPSSNKKFETE